MANSVAFHISTAQYGVCNHKKNENCGNTFGTVLLASYSISNTLCIIYMHTLTFTNIFCPFSLSKFGSRSNEAFFPGL